MRPTEDPPPTDDDYTAVTRNEDTSSHEGDPQRRQYTTVDGRTTVTRNEGYPRKATRNATHNEAIIETLVTHSEPESDDVNDQHRG
jgi:hypothetical protein